jgi:serine/threonine protein phosphatase PrpC
MMSGTEGSGASRAADIFNEDAFLVADELGLYVVCDGASGGPAGEVAASVAIAALEEFVTRAEQELDDVSAPTQHPLSTSFADGAVRHAIGAVLSAAQAEPELEGMSTTLSMLLVLGNRGVVGHCGDSRVYRIRRRKLSQLTIDHHQSEAIVSAPLERAQPGSSYEGLPIDTFAVDLELDDVFVLCTDGAVAALEDSELPRRASELSPRLLASRIVAQAHRARRDVDATVVVVHIREVRGNPSLALSDRPARASFGHALAAGASRPHRADADDEIDADELGSEAGHVARQPGRRTRARGAPDEPDESPGSRSRMRTRSS